MASVYPSFIAPLFNKYKELEEGDLKKAVYDLAGSQKFPLTKLFVIDGSTRSAHSNAYLYGFFRNKRIVIYDTLINQVDTKGIIAILAHEIGHWKKSHTMINLFIVECYYLIFFYTFGQTINNADMYHSFGFAVQSTFIGLTLFSFIYGPVEHVFQFLMNYVSRTFEYQADAFGTTLGYDLRGPLIKIHCENLSDLNVDPVYSAYHHSHPTLLERVKAITKQKDSKGKKDD